MKTFALLHFTHKVAAMHIKAIKVSPLKLILKYVSLASICEKKSHQELVKEHQGHFIPIRTYDFIA